MKLRLSIYFIRQAILIILISFQFLGCIDSENKTSQPLTKENEANDNLKEVAIPDQGENYSDSMINALLLSHSKSKETIDTFEVLHNLECNQTLMSNELIFSMDSIDAFKPYQTKVTAQLQQLLDVKDCICKYSSTENFDTFIFYSDHLESHYATPITLISISKRSNSFHQIPLVKEYGNEQHNYVISSVLKLDNTLEREVNHNVRYMHGIGAVDSIYLEREIYKVNDEGFYELKSTSRENSRKRNIVFDI